MAVICLLKVAALGLFMNDLKLRRSAISGKAADKRVENDGLKSFLIGSSQA
jgi:hypothetical protein